MFHKIILIGFMGCGKSSIGKILAERLQIPFEDTDEWIVSRQGESIADIFQKQGEEVFRKMETQCISFYQKENMQLVLATGGGLPEGGSDPAWSIQRGEENRKLLRQTGTVFYLKTTPQEVYQRLKDDRTRPLLQVSDPMKEIQTLMERRNPYYEQCAHVILDTSGKTQEEIADEIITICQRENVHEDIDY